MVFMIGLDNKKYGELVHYSSIQYEIKNDQYHKTLQEEVDVMHKVKFRIDNNND